MARRRMYGSATSETSSADRTRVSAPQPLERVLERERVQDGREHAGVVGGRPVHPLGRGRHAAVDVAAADDDRELEPFRWTPTISRAIASTVFGSVPYSWSPISASPESFRRTRRKAGAAPEGGRSASSSCAVTRQSATERALERDDTRSGLAERLTRPSSPSRGSTAARSSDAAGLRRVEPLCEHALDDLLLRLLRLRLELVRVEVDLPLGLDRPRPARPPASATRARRTRCASPAGARAPRCRRRA